MLRAGILREPEPFELIGGELVAMAAKNRQHEVLRFDPGLVGGNGHDKVGAQLDERAQRLVGERPGLIGECGGHRVQR